MKVDHMTHTLVALAALLCLNTTQAADPAEPAIKGPESVADWNNARSEERRVGKECVP